MKYAANVISLCRIAIIGILPLIYQNALLFAALYILAGLSDILDGFIARKTNTQSEFGARLDSFADLVLFAVVLILMFLWMKNDLYLFIPAVAVIALIRVGNLVITAVKYRRTAMLHTWANKLAGLLLFLCPIEYIAFHGTLFLWVTGAVAFMASVEEGVIHLTSAVPDLNRKSIFLKD